jgi:outer membrane protein
MSSRLQKIGVPTAAMLVAVTATAQENVVKVAVTEYTTHAQTNGISGIGVPPGADATVGNATTAVFTYERLLTPNVGAEIALGVPPTIKANAAGSVAFLGNDILSAKIVAPAFFLNYHFGAVGDTWRPYLGIGFNYTRFMSIQSTLASSVQMSDSWGWAVKGGVAYAVDKQWSLFGSVAALEVKTKLVASGATVLQTSIDFKPIVYTLGAAYSF